MSNGWKREIPCSENKEEPLVYLGAEGFLGSLAFILG